LTLASFLSWRPSCFSVFIFSICSRFPTVGGSISNDRNATPKGLARIYIFDYFFQTLSSTMAIGGNGSVFQGLFKAKSFEAMQADADASNLKRTLNAKDVTLIGIGTLRIHYFIIKKKWRTLAESSVHAYVFVGEIIGAGIFVITGKAAAEHAGPAIVLSFSTWHIPSFIVRVRRTLSNLAS
jgi:hypothetical protein